MELDDTEGAVGGAGSADVGVVATEEDAVDEVPVGGT